jgi:integrase
MSGQPFPSAAFIDDQPAAARRLPQEISWPQIIVAAPQMAATMARYLDQLAVSARPSTVVSVDLTLRQFARSVTTSDPTCRTMAQVTRHHFEDYKRWLARRPGKHGTLSTTTISCRLGLLRTFFERIIEWGYDDAPARVPIFAGDFPDRDEPLPKFLDDPTAAKFMASLATDPNPRRRLMVEILARTGIRSGELSGLDDDAMVLIGDIHWLRIPVGKLHNDRYVPLLPMLVELIDHHHATRPPPRSGRLVERDDGRPFDRRTIHRYVTAVAKRAGVGPVHPTSSAHPRHPSHQPRHEPRSDRAPRPPLHEDDHDLRPHLGPHRRRRVLPRHQRGRGQHQPGTPLHADTAGPIMTGLAADHHRLLGNGHCTRPAALDCIHESICENCGFFETGPEFVPVLIRQRDHATDHDQHERARLFTNLLDNLDTTQ